MEALTFWIGAFIALIITAVGITTAAMLLMGIKYDAYYERIVPACGALVITSIAAAIVMALTRWLTNS